MRQVSPLRILFIATLLLSLSGMTYAVYRKTSTLCQSATGCTQGNRPPKNNEGGELLWETLSRQFVSASLSR